MEVTMKLKNKLAAISAATMLAFTGVGYAAWTFNKDTNDTKNATVSVLAESEKGTLAISDTALYIILDQAGISYASDAAGEHPVTTLTATYTAEANGTLGENMDVDFDLAWGEAVEDWAYYVNGLTDVDAGTHTMVNGANAVSITLPTLTYTAHKPSTESEYDAMKTALNGATLTLTVTADAAADNVND